MLEMNRKKVFMMTIITVCIALYIKIIFGVIKIKSWVEFPGPDYNVTINEQFIRSNVGSIKEIKIIPYFVHYISEHGVTTQGSDECRITQGSQVVIEVSPFRCYSTVTGSKRLARCMYDNTQMILEDMEKSEYSIESMTIRGGQVYALTHHVVYEGEFRNDISDFVKNKAKYEILIKIKYQNIVSEIYTRFDIV